MKQYRQHWLIVGLLITLLILAGCSPGITEEPYGEEVAPGETEEMTESQESEVEVPEVEVPAAEPAPEQEVELSGTLVDGVREIEVVAYQFGFDPDPIRVHQGETVRLLLTTDDVAHGIGLSEFSIDARVAPGETTEITFVADTAGEFTFVCNVPCGPGHRSMTGQLVVI